MLRTFLEIVIDRDENYDQRKEMPLLAKLREKFQVGVSASEIWVDIPNNSDKSLEELSALLL